jgi:hypothetical protein
MAKFRPTSKTFKLKFDKDGYCRPSLTDKELPFPVDTLLKVYLSTDGKMTLIKPVKEKEIEV